jgi:CHRD domain
MRVSRLLAVTATLAIVLAVFGSAAVAAVGGRTFVVALTGANGGDPDGSGTAVLQVNPGRQEVCYTITVTGIGEPTEPAPGLGAAHIHDVATGGIFVDLEATFTPTATGFEATGCVTADRAKLVALISDPSAYYVNIHTAEFPGGALRGNLG